MSALRFDDLFTYKVYTYEAVDKDHHEYKNNRWNNFRKTKFLAVCNEYPDISHEDFVKQKAISEMKEKVIQEYLALLAAGHSDKAKYNGKGRRMDARFDLSLTKRILDRIEIAANKLGMSRNAYILYKVGKEDE
jgi:hypothetical protein